MFASLRSRLSRLNSEEENNLEKANPIYAKTLSPKCMLTRAPPSIYSLRERAHNPSSSINFKVIGNALLGSRVVPLSEKRAFEQEEGRYANGSEDDEENIISLR